jgi:hypothetical protein
MLKNFISPLVASAIAFLAISCASSKVVINQEYKYPSYSEPSLVIILKDNPIIDYEGNVEPEFGPGDPKTLITNFFKNQLIKDIRAQTSIQNIQFDTCSSMGYYDNHEISVGNSGTQSISVLGKGGSYTCRNSNPTYVLTLSVIFIGTAIETTYRPPVMGSNGMWMGGGSSTTKKLSYEAHVALYDNVAKEHVEYGYINESAHGFFPVITIGVWNSLSSSFVSKIFSGVHFQ